MKFSLLVKLETPQGLIINPEDNKRVWSHEHGPQGGDEINLLEGGENYGGQKLLMEKNMAEVN